MVRNSALPCQKRYLLSRTDTLGTWFPRAISLRQSRSSLLPGLWKSKSFQMEPLDHLKLDFVLEGTSSRRLSPTLTPILLLCNGPQFASCWSSQWCWYSKLSLQILAMHLPKLKWREIQFISLYHLEYQVLKKSLWPSWCTKDVVWQAKRWLGG